MTTMLLDGVKSNTSIEQPKYINVDLTGKQKVFKKTKIDETMDLYALYKKEKDSCTRYRMMFVVNPICTNVLFNKKTEVVAFEGSNSCVTLSDYTSLADNTNLTGTSTESAEINDKKQAYEKLKEDIARGKNSKYSTNGALKLYEAIKDTEFNHSELGNLTYHCGADICNNHILRAKDFVYCNVITTKSKSGDVFNTIKDIVRTEVGIEENDMVGTGVTMQAVNSRLYSIDSILTYEESFNTNIYEKDGWLGFNNASNINIPNVEYQESRRDKTKKKVAVNRVINSVGACSFIDLYPDRTLFSAVPKYNFYRHRQEHNWDYCLTYPYENDEEMLFKINGHAGDFNSVGNIGISMVVVKPVYSSSGDRAIMFRTLVNHNLHIGRYVTINVQMVDTDGKVTTKTSNTRVQVIGVGLENGFDKEKYFSVREGDMPSGIMLKDSYGEYSYVDSDDPYSPSKILLSYKQNVNGVDCQYYVRKFKKIKRKDGEDLRYSVSKLAFGNNIYGDEMAQVIFDDDIVLDGLKDNLGRELTEIYLTVIKTNRGHKLWYGRPNIADEKKRAIEMTKNKQKAEVEYSHCFGKVTSGVIMNEGGEDYNVEKLHNIDMSKTDNGMGWPMVCNGFRYSLENKHTKSYYEGTKVLFGDVTPPKTVEDDITSEQDIFYGDIVEFNPIKYQETILSSICYRFNTAQRECYDNDEYFNIFKDEITNDNFEVPVSGTSHNTGFNVDTSLINVTEYISDAKCANDGADGSVKVNKVYMAGNLNPEGYYYNPHHKIVVKELAEELEEVDVTRLNIDKESVDNYIVYSTNRDANSSYDFVRILSPRDYGFKKGGTVIFYDRITQKSYFGVIDTVIMKQILIVRVRTDSKIAGITNISGQIDESTIPGKTTTFNPDKNNVFKIKDDILVLFTNVTVPSYAIFRPNTSSFIWRPSINVTDVQSASTLYDVPFSNGAIYIEKNLNIFVKRQDPRGENYLYNYADSPKRAKDSASASATSYSEFLRKCGMPKLDIRYLLEGEDNISFDLC